MIKIDMEALRKDLGYSSQAEIARALGIGGYRSWQTWKKKGTIGLAVDMLFILGAEFVSIKDGVPDIFKIGGKVYSLCGYVE